MKTNFGLSVLAAATAVAGMVSPVMAQPCEWAEGFHLPGVTGEVASMAVYNDGSGDALYVGGRFSAAGTIPAKGIAKWDGNQWSAVGEGVSGSVFALTVHDDGSGRALYAAGDFGVRIPGMAPALAIAKWDGKRWSALGSGLGFSPVRALAVHDDGSGAALYAGGEFDFAGDQRVNHVAKWDGQRWSALGTGTDDSVQALASYDDGTGAALYAAGFFTHAGGVSANHVAKWDGNRWSPLGTGTNARFVQALTVYRGESGSVLYAGGDFTSAGGVSANYVAAWDGNRWSALGSGTDHWVNALAIHDDGNGHALYVGGGFDVAGGVSAHRVAKWDGSRWSSLGDGIGGNFVLALASYSTGGASSLYAGGDFTFAGALPATFIAQWNASYWSALGVGGNGITRTGSYASVPALETYDDGNGLALYAGGYFASAGGVPANNIARWDGQQWRAVGRGTNNKIRSLKVFDDGGGLALYAGGDFSAAGGVPANHIAKWDGQRWSALDSGVNGGVHALAEYNDGRGPALYAAGTFSTAGGVPANGIAKWDGTRWSALGSGASNGVWALAVYDDDGGEPWLYAGGDFTYIGGVSANHIAKWNGTRWSTVGTGTDRTVTAMAAYDDGRGSALYAGGYFITAGGLQAGRIAKWDGFHWFPVSDGIDGDYPSVNALTVFDDGNGPALYAVGAFDLAGRAPANNIAKWDGRRWSPLAEGMVSRFASEIALKSYGNGNGAVLYVGGNFVIAGGRTSAGIAGWRCPGPWSRQ